jgi:hypothetical protein
LNPAVQSSQSREKREKAIKGLITTELPGHIVSVSIDNAK